MLSGGAIALMMDWRLALAVWGVFIVLFVATKMVSLGSLGGGLVFIAMTALIYRSVLIAVIGTVIGVLIFWQHRGNIVRILKGEERTFRLRGKSKNSEEEA